MPVVFGDAADCSRLLYWAVLVNVQFRSAQGLLCLAKTSGNGGPFGLPSIEQW